MRTGSRVQRWKQSFNLVSAGGKTALKGLKYENNLPESLFALKRFG